MPGFVQNFQDEPVPDGPEAGRALHVLGHGHRVHGGHGVHGLGVEQRGLRELALQCVARYGAGRTDSNHWKIVAAATKIVTLSRSLATGDSVAKSGYCKNLHVRACVEHI